VTFERRFGMVFFTLRELLVIYIAFNGDNQKYIKKQWVTVGIIMVAGVGRWPANMKGITLI
jgi:hypothetical protein